MGFSCTIKAGNVDLTSFVDGVINGQLLDLAPNTVGATDAPYRLEDLRAEVQACAYGDKYREPAQDCFKELQRMAKANLKSLEPKRHCDNCTCPEIAPINRPDGWSIEAIERLLAIDPKIITYVSGGW